MCSDPLGVDDPHSKSDIDKLLVDLYNGKKGATMGRGDRQPASTAIIASNFSPADQGRLALFNYFSCASCHGDMQLHTQMCIKVHIDTLQAATAFHVSLIIHGDCGIAKEVGSCVAFLIGLGEKFFSSGMTEFDRDLIPTILS